MTSFHPEGVEDHLLVLASTTQPQEEGAPSSVRVQLPRSQAYFTGTGLISYLVPSLRFHCAVYLCSLAQGPACTFRT